MEPIIEIKNMSYVYEDIPVLNRVSLDIYPGERIAVLGANGAGKSTFFLNLNGVLAPDSGEIYYRGRIISKKTRTQLREHVGIVFQEADEQIIMPTVEAEIAFGPLNQKLPQEEVKKRITDILKQMQMEPMSQRPPHDLSGGEKKRVTIADVLVMKPEVLILDEPQSSLDPQGRKEFVDLLKTMTEEGQSVLLSTHDMDFAYGWAKRCLVFCEGRLLADDTCENIFLDEQILKQAHLEKPKLLQFQQLLQKEGLLKAETHPMKKMKDLKEELEKQMNKK